MSDVIDVSRITILNSPDVRAWPVTTRLTRLELRTTGVHVEFDKQATWPDVPFDRPGEPLQYTLWLLLQIAGAWYASGILQFWRGLEASGGDVTFENQIARNWVYDARWGPMKGHQPSAGELVGFMVSAGNARGVDQHLVAERSTVVVVAFPGSTPVVYPPFVWEEDAPAPPPPPPPPPVDADIGRLIDTIVALTDADLKLLEAIVTLEARVHDLEENGLKVHL